MSTALDAHSRDWMAFWRLLGRAKHTQLALVRDRGYDLPPEEAPLQSKSPEDIVRHYKLMADAAADSTTVMALMSMVYTKPLQPQQGNEDVVANYGKGRSSRGDGEAEDVDMITDAAPPTNGKLSAVVEPTPTAAPTTHTLHVVFLGRRLDEAQVERQIAVERIRAGVASVEGVYADNPAALAGVHYSLLLVTPYDLSPDGTKEVTHRRHWVQVIHMHNLSIPLTARRDSFPHIALNSEEAERVRERFRVCDAEMPIIARNDAVAGYRGFKVGTVVQIHRGFGASSFRIVT